MTKENRCTNVELTHKDCIVIGGGPAGLTAAIYLARFHLSVAVFDDGTSRAALIPISHNHSGFPGGIRGEDLLHRMREQAIAYGAEFHTTRVSALDGIRDDFRATTEDGPFLGRTVLLATGLINERPPMPKALHDDALAGGLIRYCPVCDGYEVTDKRIAVVGLGPRALHEAVFLRSYSKDVTLLSPADKDGLTDEERGRLSELGIAVRNGPLEIAVEQDLMRVNSAGAAYEFDALYPALGSEIRSELAAGIGASLTSDGCILVDSHQRTDIPGVYAAGDAVAGLDQISHAMGQAGVAATAIRNDLSDLTPLIR